MGSHVDTFDVSPLHRRELGAPLASVEDAERQANHPEAAAHARARIASITDRYEMIDAASMPALPPEQLVTDRQTLADRYRATPGASRRKLPSVVRPALTAVGIFALMLLLFKSPVILGQLGYSLNKPTATPMAPAAAIIPAEPTITIPKINVHAPVIYQASTVEAQFQKALENGVVHYGSTAMPGQVGNTVIFGHSSNDWWEPGNYKFVFVLLDKLVAGDRFTIDYQSKRYTYEVTGSKVVEPNNLSVLAPSVQPTVTLITCTPPGTAWKRLVVTAKQVDPDPRGAAPATSATSDSAANLPGAAPNFMSQLDKTWNSIIHGFTALFKRN